MLTPEKANKIFTFLVERCGANEQERSQFLGYVAYVEENGRRDGEYRFRGIFGFGGKFYWGKTRCTINGYAEDMTDELVALRAKLHGDLQEIWNGI